ncbi:helix-turn-helix transcriptional regulator [Chitinophaga filiformis]|uniref:winged helix-turn-helix transcriptional regulator n=1 Tax=Chitinophaga filiformis TaxID=104663 RepID=UPI001F16809F|nr:helix-turn-helix domain-containing protein [Chitinophaga filiformis]MCF6402281.1 helix-turn-helix transcriptional regulator [Chitinophaga filiformis]
MAERKTNSSNFQNQSYLESKCPLNELLFTMSRRWTTDVLFCIEEGNNRFSGIREELAYITDHILSDRLKTLEKSGLITRHQFPGMPPKVTYALTEHGVELCNLLSKLCDFSHLIYEDKAVSA